MTENNASIDTTKIFVVDNVAPDWLYFSWLRKIQSAQRWKYGMAATRQDYGRFFVMWIAQAGNHRGPRGPFTGDFEGIADCFNELWQNQHLATIIPDAEITNIHRVHFNGQFPTNNKLSLHYDWDMPDMWSVVYYLDGEDGDTVFYNSPQVDENGELIIPSEVHRVEFKPNRAVFFPSYYWHAAENPKSGFRISLAFNYFLNRCAINNEIRKDRGIESQILPPPDLTDFINEIEKKQKYERLHKKMEDTVNSSKTT